MVLHQDLLIPMGIGTENVERPQQHCSLSAAELGMRLGGWVYGGEEGR